MANARFGARLKHLVKAAALRQAAADLGGQCRVSRSFRQDQLGSFAIGNVALDRHEVRQLLVFVVDGLHFDFEPVTSSRFGVVDDFDFEALALAEPLADVGDRRTVGVGTLQDFAWLASDDFVEGIPRQAGETVVHPFDPARRVGENHSVIGAAGDHRKLARFEFAGP